MLEPVKPGEFWDKIYIGILQFLAKSEVKKSGIQENVYTVLCRKLSGNASECGTGTYVPILSQSLLSHLDPPRLAITSAAAAAA